MGSWGVCSYEVDEAADAIDGAFETVHGSKYESLMDDRNPLSFDEVQQQLANPDTLAAALGLLKDDFGPDLETWDELERLGYCGVIVRHQELGVPIPIEHAHRAIEWLESEEIDWEPQADRDARRRTEIDALRRAIG